MRIQSIRLKNIKSYGEGPDGTGVTVRFESGVNRVAGRNGHGKTTLIECIGYALFLTEPQFEENFQTETYFLSHGARDGEIELTFECGGELFRVERPVGKTTRRRPKVIQLSDQSICAEGDQEVSAFLCRLLKFPEPRQLSEVFSKLIGVQQGRLAWPFDSKPAEAKRHFEPLLEVAVFRDCFERLKGSVETFQEQRNGHVAGQAAINERIRERADSPATLADARRAVESTTAALRNAEKDREIALKLKERLEAQARAVEVLQVAQKHANERAVHTRALRAETETRLNEAKAAGQVLADTHDAHRAHLEALEALVELERRREVRDDLVQKRNATEAKRSNSQQQAVAAREQAAVFVSQCESKQKESDDLAGKIAGTTAALDATAGGFKESAEAADAAGEHRDVLSGWIDGLAGWARSQRRIADAVARLSREISGWDGTRLKLGEEVERKAAVALKTAEDQLARAEQREATLGEQLRQIAGGVCPFLKEQCRQFDPARVQADLKLQTSNVAALRAGADNARTAHQNTVIALSELRAVAERTKGKESDLSELLQRYGEEAPAWMSEEAAASFRWLSRWEPRIPPIPAAAGIPSGKPDPAAVATLQEQSESFIETAAAWWRNADATIRARLKAFREEEKVRQSREAARDQLSKQLTGLALEIQGLAEKAAEKKKQALQHEQELQQRTAEVARLNGALAPFANMDADLKREQQKRDAHRAAHERHLGARAIAEDLLPRQARFQQMQTEEGAAQEALRSATAALQKADREFDPERLRAARDDHQARHDQATTLTVKLDSEKAFLKQEERRFKEWEQACRDRDQVSAEIGRCEAAIELTELARRTLRDTAPAVAQHLCIRIATRAQRVFNQISPEPIELEWNAERYSLRVTPGDRRFAMLSGGEQTKLALAMTLAMIEELCGLRFCSFDEPTYGVDADSRSKLADAIIRAQEAAGLDQLLIVSHDDAFEGKSGHAILLEKSIHGTRVALIQ